MKLSVRLRLTFIAAAIAGGLVTVGALVAPGIVESALIDDLVESQADDVEVFLDTGIFLTDDEVAEMSDDEFASFEEIMMLEAGAIRDDLAQADRVPLLVDEFGERSVLTPGGGVFVSIVDGSEVAADAVAATGGPVLTSSDAYELLFAFDDVVFADEPEDLVDFVDIDDLSIGTVDVDGVEYIVVADRQAVDRSVDRVGSALWWVLPIAVVVAGAVTWLLAGRALRPVRSITDRAARISGGTLDARVPVPETGDEIATLATTVNGMLDRLEQDDRRRRRFVSDASHELRTPVAVMKNEAEVALRHPDTIDVAELAGAVASESSRMGTIIDDLLSLARHDEGLPAPVTEVDLDDLVLDEVKRARRVPVAARRVSAGRVRGRADELGRLVGHLVDNAARHARSAVEVALETTGDAVVLTVDDDGPGVPPAERARIFERFARLDEARSRDAGGAGLGLAVVAGIAERSGGEVTVGDAPLGGARFTVTFPS